MQELRQGTEQKIRVGVLLNKNTNAPILNYVLGQGNWRHIVKPDESVIDADGHTWGGIAGCNGCYYLTLTAEDTSLLGSLTLFIYDSLVFTPVLAAPFFETFNIIKPNIWDSKYGGNLLQVEQFAQKG